MWFAQRFFEASCVSSFGDIDVFCFGPTFMAACMAMMPILLALFHITCIVHAWWHHDGLRCLYRKNKFHDLWWDGFHLQKGFALVLKKQI